MAEPVWIVPLQRSRTGWLCGSCFAGTRYQRFPRCESRQDSELLPGVMRMIGKLDALWSPARRRQGSCIETGLPKLSEGSHSGADAASWIMRHAFVRASPVALRMEPVESYCMQCIHDEDHRDNVIPSPILPLGKRPFALSLVKIFLIFTPFFGQTTNTPSFPSGN